MESKTVLTRVNQNEIEDGCYRVKEHITEIKSDAFSGLIGLYAIQLCSEDRITLPESGFLGITGFFIIAKNTVIDMLKKQSPHLNRHFRTKPEYDKEIKLAREISSNFFNQFYPTNLFNSFFQANNVIQLIEAYAGMDVGLAKKFSIHYLFDLWATTEAKPWANKVGKIKQKSEDKLKEAIPFGPWL